MLSTSQYDLNEIIEKIKNKIPFELKDNERSRTWTLRVIISKLYYSLDYENEPQATRQKVTELLLYHGQFSRKEIDEMFQLSVKETTQYSMEFLKQHPEIAQAEGLEIKYIFPHYC